MGELKAYQNFLDKTVQETTEMMGSFNNFLNETFIENYLRKKIYINENYIQQWDELFNLFKIISPQFYQRERLHSEIIGAIFDTKTPEIANKIYLKKFIELLMRKEKNIKLHDFMDNYTVKLEEPIHIDDKGSIDILIYDDTDAIIIENKIHNARDTKNQLAKYYKHVTEIMEKNVIAIVYLPLDPNKNPSLSSYHSGYEKYSPTINKILVSIPVISINGINDFVHGFLDCCYKIAKNLENYTAMVFLKQYIQLLKYLGGKSMALGNEKELFAEFFKTKKSISIINDIVEIVENKSLYLKLLFCDSFIKELQSKNFESFEGNSEMRLKLSEDLFLVFYHWEDEKLGFGFRSEKRIPDKKRTALKNLLKDEKYSDHFSDLLDWGDDWVCKEIKILDFGDVPINETIKFFTKLLLDSYASLKKEAMNIK
jgi:hypothetical protein